LDEERMIPARYLEVLRDRVPGVEFAPLRLVESGYANDVVVVDERLVVRFGKHDWGAAALAAERRVLELAGPRLTTRVPRWETWADDVVAYPKVPGVALEAQDFCGLPGGDKRRLAGEIARFLHQLHSIPVAEGVAAGVGEADARCRGDGYEALMAEARRGLFPARDAAWRDRALRLFAEVRAGVLDAGGASALVHADLAACHLLWDGTAPRLSGVIDFGCAGLGDPAADVAALLEVYGEEIVAPLLAELPEAREYLDRARAYAAISLVQRELDEVNGLL